MAISEEEAALQAFQAQQQPPQPQPRPPSISANARYFVVVVAVHRALLHDPADDAAAAASPYALPFDVVYVPVVLDDGHGVPSIAAMNVAAVRAVRMHRRLAPSLKGRAGTEEGEDGIMEDIIAGTAVLNWKRLGSLADYHALAHEPADLPPLSMVRMADLPSAAPAPSPAGAVSPLSRMTDEIEAAQEAELAPLRMALSRVTDEIEAAQDAEHAAEGNDD